MSGDQIAMRAEKLRQIAEQAQTDMAALRMQLEVQQTALQFLLAQLVKAAGPEGLEAVRIQTVATLASPVAGSAGDNPERQAMLHAIAARFFAGVYEAAGLPKPKAWGGDA